MKGLQNKTLRIPWKANWTTGLCIQDISHCVQVMYTIRNKLPKLLGFENVDLCYYLKAEVDLQKRTQQIQEELVRRLSA